MDCIICGTSFDSFSNRCHQCDWDPDKLHDFSDFPEGKVLDRYKIIKAVSIEPLYMLIHAQDNVSGKKVACKIIHRSLIPDEGTGNKFLEGMRSIASVSHSGVNRILNVCKDQDNYFAVYETQKGFSLSQLINRRREMGKNFEIPEIFSILEQLVGILDSLGLSHGCLSPETIRIEPENLQITDLGLCKFLPSQGVWHRLYRRSSIKWYLSPDYTFGRSLGKKFDVYSLGVLAGEMLTGNVFEGDPIVFSKTVSGEKTPFYNIISRSTSVRALDRYDSPGELYEVLTTQIKEPTKEHFMQSVESTDGQPGDKHKNTVKTEVVKMDDIIGAHDKGVAKTDSAGPPVIKAGPPVIKAGPPVVKAGPPPKRPAVPEPAPHGQWFSEVTREIDLGEIEMLGDESDEDDNGKVSEALSTLEERVKNAEQESIDELIRNADKLDGVSPRFVRAAQALESEKRSSKYNREISLLKEQSESLKGIDSRLLRAAASSEDSKRSSAEKNRRIPEWKSTDEVADQQIISFMPPSYRENPLTVKSPEKPESLTKKKKPDKKQ